MSDDYRERVRAAALLQGRKMVKVRCPLKGCRHESAAIYDSPRGPLYEATVPFPDFVADLAARGELDDKQVVGAHVSYPTRRVLELVEDEESGLVVLDAACRNGHVGTVTMAQVRDAVDRYRTSPGKPAQTMHAKGQRPGLRLS